MNIKAFSVNCLTDKRWRLSRELRMYIESVVKENSSVEKIIEKCYGIDTTSNHNMLPTKLFVFVLYLQCK